MVTDLPYMYNEGSFVYDVLFRVFSCVFLFSYDL